MITGKRLAWLLAYLYCISYVTRINFAAIIQEVITDRGFEKSELSVILVCLSISYGVGQIVNGRIGDKIKPQNLIFVGLCTATAANLLFPLFSFSIPIMCVLWTVNGFAQAMMWPPMVKIMVSTMDELTYGTSVVIVSVGSSVGTILVYLTAPFVIKLSGWESIMYGAAVLGAISAIIWFLLKNRCYREEAALPYGKPSVSNEAKLRIPIGAWFPFILIAVGIILQGMIRDGVTSWMPTYLSENFGFDNEKSIFLTLSLAVFSVISFVVSGAFYRRLFKNEVTCAGVIYAFAAVCGAILWIFFDIGGTAVAVLMMALITGSMHGVNLMLISHVPKRFRKYGNISTMSGIVNSFTYIGSAIATYGVARISELCGWKTTVLLWFGILITGTALCFAAVPRWRRFTE